MLKRVDAGRADHRARGRRRSRSKTDAEDRPGDASRCKVEDDAGGPLRPPGRRDRPVRQPGRRRPGADDLGQEGRDEAPDPGRPPDVQGRRGRRTVNLHSRGPAGTALLAWEADRILSYRLVALKEGDNPLAWAVDGAAVPQLHADRRADGRDAVRRGPARRPRRARPAGDGHADEAGGRAGRGGRGRGRRPPTSSAARSRPRCRWPWSTESLLRLYDDTPAADRPVLLRPDAHRGVRDRVDQHVPLRAGDARRCAEAVVEEAERPRRSRRTTAEPREVRQAGRRGRSLDGDARRGRHAAAADDAAPRTPPRPPPTGSRAAPAHGGDGRPRMAAGAAAMRRPSGSAAGQADGQERRTSTSRRLPRRRTLRRDRRPTRGAARSLRGASSERVER